MTSHLDIIFNAHSEVQNDITLKPEKWMWENQNDVKEKVKSSLHKPNEEFRKGRDEFIESCITLVYQQRAHGNKDHIDSIVDMQKLAASEKICEDVAAKLMQVIELAGTVMRKLARFCESK